MFAVVRTGGKQYRVAAGDKIAVEKLAGEAGDTVVLDDVLLAGEGADIKDVKGLTVSAEIVAQTRGEKVIVFKKRRRHNYRRRNGHRQSLTLLKIVSIGAEARRRPLPRQLSPSRPRKPHPPRRRRPRRPPPRLPKPERLLENSRS